MKGLSPDERLKLEESMNEVKKKHASLNKTSFSILKGKFNQLTKKNIEDAWEFFKNDTNHHEQIENDQDQFLESGENIPFSSHIEELPQGMWMLQAAY